MAIEDNAGDRSHVQILKSTAVIGGASLINIAFAILRNKFIAVLLGPQGVGLMALYTSIVDLAQALAGLGVQASGVRQIAEAVGTAHLERISRTVFVLRRISLLLGLAATALLVLFAYPVAELTFADRSYGVAVMIVAAGAVLQNSLGRPDIADPGDAPVSDLATISVLGAILSTAISIPLIYWFREKGIAWSILAVAIVTLLTSWWYSRKIQVQATASMSARDLMREIAPLLRLGAVFMASSFLTAGAAYAIRIIVLKYDGVVAAGSLSGRVGFGWALCGVYPPGNGNRLLSQAYRRFGRQRSLQSARQRTDPSERLAGRPRPYRHRDGRSTGHDALLFGGVFAGRGAHPLVLPWHDGAHLAWPMGFIIVAKGAAKLFFWTEVAATVVHVGLAALWCL